MKITNVMLWMVILAFAFLLLGNIEQGKTNHEDREGLLSARDARHDVIYSCRCLQKCGTPTVSTRPGEGSCGKELTWGHILKIVDSQAVICQCPEGCRCYAADPQHPTECTCGLKTRRVDLAGSGIYFCNCGYSCFCNYVSDSPGKCRCGSDLVRNG